jgi:Fic family protein
MLISIKGTHYHYRNELDLFLKGVRERASTLEALRASVPVSTHELVHDFLRLRHVYHSNKIEGNILTFGETVRVVTDGLEVEDKPLKETVEARNLAGAYDWAETIAIYKKTAINSATIRDIQHVVALDLEGLSPGNYRQVFVIVGGSRHLPPEPARIFGKMREFELWLSKAIEDPNIDPLVLACVAHTWLVTIHPFVDGNGRTSRLLLNMILTRRNYPVSVLSKDDQFRYYDAIEDSHIGDLTPLLRLFGETISESIAVYEQAQRDPNVLQTILDNAISVKGKTYYEFNAFGHALQGLMTSFKNLLENDSHYQDVYLGEYNFLEYDTYQLMIQRRLYKMSWFFRLYLEEKSVIWAFNHATASLSPHLGSQKISLRFYHENAHHEYDFLPASFCIQEIGYNLDDEQFVYRDNQGNIEKVDSKTLAQKFLQEWMGFVP